MAPPLRPSLSATLISCGLLTLRFSGKPNTAKAIEPLIQASSDAGLQQVLARKTQTNIQRYRRIEAIPFVGKRLPRWEARTIERLVESLEGAAPGFGTLLQHHVLPRLRQQVIQTLSQQAGESAVKPVHPPITLAPIATTITPVETARLLMKRIVLNSLKPAHPKPPSALVSAYYTLPTPLRDALETLDATAVQRVETYLEGLYPSLGHTSFRHLYQSIKQGNVNRWKHHSP